MARKARISPMEHRFLDYWMEVVSAGEAARRAGYKGDHPRQWASKVLAKPVVQEELKRRQAELRDLTKITLAQQIARYERHITDAKAGGQHMAAVKAEDSIAKMLGHLFDKKQVSGTISLTDGRTVEDLRSEVLSLVSELGILPDGVKLPALPAPNGKIVDV